MSASKLQQGINIEGKCKNENCKSFEQPAWQQSPGFGKFEVKQLIENAKCSECDDFLQAVTKLGFYMCDYKAHNNQQIKGIHQDDNEDHHEIHNNQEDWDYLQLEVQNLYRQQVQKCENDECQLLKKEKELLNQEIQRLKEKNRILLNENTFLKNIVQESRTKDDLDETFLQNLFQQKVQFVSMQDLKNLQPLSKKSKQFEIFTANLNESPILLKKFDNEKMFQFEHELRINTQLAGYQHPNVLISDQYTIQFQKNNVQAGLISPYSDIGDLKQVCVNNSGFLKNMENSNEKLKLQLSLCLQIAKGLKHVHSIGLLHLDINPSNLIIYQEKQEYILKISDFGSAQHKDINDKIQNNNNTSQAKYMPWEYLSSKDNVRISQKTDIWSLGCTMFSIFAELKPYNMFNNEQQIVNHILDKSEFFDKKNQCESSRLKVEPIREILEKCLQIDCESRCSLDCVISFLNKQLKQL